MRNTSLQGDDSSSQWFADLRPSLRVPCPDVYLGVDESPAHRSAEIDGVAAGQGDARRGLPSAQSPGSRARVADVEWGERRLSAASCARWLPFMADLREAPGQTIHLAVFDRTEVVYVEIPHRKTPALPSKVGGRLPPTQPAWEKRCCPLRIRM